MDLQELKKRLRAYVKDDQWTAGLKVEDITSAADAIEQLQRELENERIERQAFQHGHRIASDNCVRLERELGEARKDAANLRSQLGIKTLAQIQEEGLRRPSFRSNGAV